MAKATRFIAAADRAAVGQLAAVDATAACEAGNHHRCHGTILSLTADHGRQCQCPCHDGDDLAVEAALERAHYGAGSLFDLDL
jgi:hypothetical protein